MILVFWMLSFKLTFSLSSFTFISSVQFSSVMSDSLRPHGLQHTRPPCPPLIPRVVSSPRLMSIELVMPSNHLVFCWPLFLLSLFLPSIWSVQSLSCVPLFAIPWTAPCQASLSITNSRSYSNSCLLSQWCHTTILSSVIPFCSHLQSFLASGSLPRSQFFASGGKSIGVSASASVLPMNIQDWFPLGWTGWISLQSKGLSRIFFNTTVQKHQFFGAQLSLESNCHNPCMTTGKTIALTSRTFVCNMSLFFNMLSKLIIVLLPRSKHVLISWLQSPSAVILEPKKIKSKLFPLFPYLFALKWWGQMPWS